MTCSVRFHLRGFDQSPSNPNWLWACNSTYILQESEGQMVQWPTHQQKPQTTQSSANHWMYMEYRISCIKSLQIYKNTTLYYTTYTATTCHYTAITSTNITDFSMPWPLVEHYTLSTVHDQGLMDYSFFYHYSILWFLNFLPVILFVLVIICLVFLGVT